MNNPWKLATFGMALAAITALVTGATTAYFMRPSATAEVMPAIPAANPRSRPAVTVASRPSPRPASPAPAPGAPAASRPSSPVIVPAASTVPAPPVTASVPEDCATGGERAKRIAKPGFLGGLLGAGVGAAGGAIADGGKGAGKGALIGGVAGAVLGSGYGAYKTKEECGTIFGNGSATAAAPPTTPPLAPAERLEAPQAAFQPTTEDGIVIYSVR